MKQLYYTLLILFGCNGFLPAMTPKATTNTADVHRGALERSSLYNDWMPAVYNSPAAKVHQWKHRFSSFGGEWRKRDADVAYRVQDGKGAKNWMLEAQSYLPLSAKDVVWGEASYEHQYISELLLTSTSDYDLLYPQIIADNAKHNAHVEKYEFGGGYGRKLRRWSWGAEGHFRALYEYRKEDPRASNVVGDLHAKAGISYYLECNYALYVEGNARKYKQNSDVQPFSGNGSTQWMMTGPACYNYRFSTQSVNALYRGNTFGIDAGVFTRQREGVNAGIHYAHTKLNRLVNDLTHLIPISDLVEHASSVSIGWRQNIARHKIAVKGEASYIHRTSIEHVLGDSYGGVYPVVADFDQYYSERIHLTATMLYGYTVGRLLSFEIAPYAGTRRFSEHTILPDQQRKLDFLTAGADFSLQSCFLKRHAVVLKAHGEWMKNTDKSLVLKTGRLVITDFDMESKLGRIIAGDYRQQTTDFFSIDYSLRYAYALNDRLALFLSGSYYTRLYAEPMSNSKYSVSCGINF